MTNGTLVGIGPTRVPFVFSGTRISDNAFERFPDAASAAAATIVLGRIGEPDDVGRMIATPPGDEGRWITAQNIEVSGGQNL